MSTTSDNALQANQLPVSLEINQNQDLSQTITQIYRRIARAVNTKEGSIYDLVEQGNFKQFFTPLAGTPGIPFVYRPCYRYTFDLVALNGANIPGGAAVSFVHGIVGLTATALLYASCTSIAGDFFTVVYPNATATTTNINFVNPLGVALTSAIFVFEYLKT